jgi:hypothetical protein
MNKLALYSLLVFFTKVSYCQDQNKISGTDSLANHIDSLNLKISLDSTILPAPPVHPIAKVYFTYHYLDSSTLNKITWISQFYFYKKERLDKIVIDKSEFYYDQNRPQKVIDTYTDGNKKSKLTSYFCDNDAFFFTTDHSKKANEQFAFYLNYSNQYVKKFLNRKEN